MKKYRWLLLTLLASTVGAQAPVAVDTSALSGMKVFPNPWQSNVHPNVPIRFTPLPGSSTVEIFTIAGQRVRSLGVSGDEADWDCTNDDGQAVASGIYLYLVKDSRGDKLTGKLAVIR